MTEPTIEQLIDEVISMTGSYAIAEMGSAGEKLALAKRTELRSALLSRIEDVRQEADDSKSKVKSIHFKTSEQERFIWWIHQVYARNVQDLIAEILEACTYQDEATAASGKYGLPIKCFEHMERLRKYSHEIYDGTYLDVEISTVVKTSTDNYKCSWIQEDDPDIGLWRTGCKNTFYLDADKPSDNHMKYCCYCGREIKEED